MNARDATLALLASREPDATICPSEVARSLVAHSEDTAAQWRGKMPEVHTAIDALLNQGLIRISWKGKSLSKRVGPYRIGSERG
jgi:hypothetical protein